MGMITTANTLDDMCALMCDNAVPETWIFTFGQGQEHAGHYVRIRGSYGSAREEMFRRYGDKWAFQYSEQEWQDWLDRKPPYIPAETELEVKL